VARKKVPEATFQQGNAMVLPFEDDIFDVITSSFMLMFVPDQVKAVSEMWRVLRPGGRLVISVWESLANNPVYEDLVAIARHRINEAAGNSLAMPFALGEEGRLMSILKAAGIDSAVISSYPGRARFPSLEGFVTTEIKAWVLGDSVNDDQVDSVVADAKIKLDSYTGDDNSIDFPFDAMLAKAEKSKV
jgi:SAM-dependent methyltransferase